MRIKHEDAVVLEAIVRRTFNCERGGMGGFVDADHFEREPFDAAIIAIAPLWQRSNPKEIEEFLFKWESVLRDENIKDADIHTCTICGNVEKVAHTWNNGTITKAPTCKEEGEKTYTCTACGATKTEKVSKTNNHKYGGWEVVKEATYSSKGERIRKCTVCGIIIAREDIPVKTSESTTTTTTTTTAATTTATTTTTTTTAATTTATTTTTTAATTTMTTAATTTATTTTTTATTTTTTPAATTTSSQSRGCKANIGVRASAVCVEFLGAVVIVLRKKREN